MSTESQRDGTDVEVAHTPGPWEFESPPSQYLSITIFAPPGTLITRLYQHGRDTDLANARLIAAAPDLLEACKIMREELTGCANDHRADWHDWHRACDVDAAIAKATGKAVGKEG